MGILYNVKNLLIKKFDCIDLYDKGHKIEIVFKYKNFILPKESGFELRVQNKKTAAKFRKAKLNHLVMEVDKADLVFQEYEPFLKLNLYYNNEKLWVKNTVENELYLSLDNVLCKFKTGKDMFIKKVNESQLFLNKYVKSRAYIEGSNLIFNISKNINFNQLLLVKESDNILIDIKQIGDAQFTIPIENIESLVMQEFDRVFLIKDDVAYRVKFNDEYEFNLYHYHIQINDRQFYVYHKILNVSNIVINEAPNKTGYIVKINKTETEPIIKFENLILMNNENHTIETYPVRTFDDHLTVKIPFETLTENASKKKLYIEGIEIDGDTERSVIYSIREQYADRAVYQSNISINNQYYIMEFYSKRGIELLYRKPFFKNGINYIKNDKINFFIKADDLYSHCTFTLTFEDRYTNDCVEYQIDVGETELKLDYEAIDQIVSKSKTVVDLFINIKEEDTIVRKEKIRYRTVKYKKDAFFSQYVFDSINERVFYLSTITPFKNIKLERFSITKEQMNVMNAAKKDNNTWLISERFDTAQDNGIVFFKWLQQYTNIDAYYVIDTESADYSKIKDYDNVLEFGSLKHFEIANKAKVLISTHDLENVLPYKPAKGFYGYEHTLKVFLQHGVLGRKNVEYHKAFYDLPFDMFNVSSESEKQDVVVNQMGYAPQNVYVTGLSRFDELPINEDNQQIKKVLIMPTWRDWLNSDIAFENSEYLERYLNLTKNRELNQLIENNNIEINFYPHYRAQHYFKLFLTNNHIRVKYVELGERTVQSLLIEHDLLITDYSSVSFDFTYMNKPVIFYHFDVKRFFRKGILRPIHETFLGDIVNDEKSLVTLIKSYVEGTNDVKPVNKQSIFTNIDQSNNLRIYENILQRLESETQANFNNTN